MTPADDLRAARGRSVECSRCFGHGLVGHQIPDECPDCGGSGRNWLYPNGALARYYSGPLLGRDPDRAIAAAESSK